MKLPESTDIFNIKGAVLSSEPMWRHTTFGVGGAAELYAVPADTDDLARLLTAAGREGIPVFILGGGSNLLVSDKGISGLVIDTRSFRDYYLESGGKIAAAGPSASAPNTAAQKAPPAGQSPDASSSDVLVLGAGLPISDAAWTAGSQGLAGLEMFFAMPGSVGGAIWMNARCYGGEIADRLLWADIMLPGGRLQRIEKQTDQWSYKKSPFQTKKAVIVRGAFAMDRKDPKMLREQMLENRNHREQRGHFRAPCAGSTFKNNRQFGEPSGALIDRCGLKGQREGGAAVSSWHGNILINDGGACAADILTLIKRIAGEVEERTGFRMEMEVQLAGDWPGDCAGDPPGNLEKN